MIRVVLDTNVLVSALISPLGNEALVLDAVQNGWIVPCLTREIVEEYAEVLARPRFSFARKEIDGLLGLLELKGMLFEPLPAPGTSSDPGDECFIECALQGNADFIVTGNKRHFPAESCAPAKVVSARELLELLRAQRSR
jgi:putative PIN family toxin of toxin-antitoxin system